MRRVKVLAVAGMLGVVALGAAPQGVSAQGTCKEGFELTAIGDLKGRAAKRAERVDDRGNENGYVCVKAGRFLVQISDDTEPPL